MDRRKHTRVPFEVTAIVRTSETSITGTVDNLSMKGMFLTTRESLPEDSPLDISVILSGTSSRLSINMKGAKARQTEEGIAVEFLEMDLDSFTHLRSIIAQNSENPDEVYKEYYEAILSKYKPDDTTS